MGDQADDQTGSGGAQDGPGWHRHGKLRHAHAHAEIEHHHLLRAVCGRIECAAFPTHNIHRGPESAESSLEP